MIQPSLMPDGWIELKDGDESARTIFDRHYSRRVYRDGRKPSKLFVGPGRKKPLMRADGSALFVWRQFISDDGQAGVNCAIFRRESGDVEASELIRQAVTLARETWPTERFYTYVDPRKVKPTMFRGYPVWGWCFYKAGWKFDSIGKAGKHVLYLPAAL